MRLKLILYFHPTSKNFLTRKIHKSKILIYPPAFKGDPWCPVMSSMSSLKRSLRSDTGQRSPSFLPLPGVLFAPDFLTLPLSFHQAYSPVLPYATLSLSYPNYVYQPPPPPSADTVCSVRFMSG
jgi:hypothetical protein